MKTIQPGNILQGPYWQEQVRVILVKTIGVKKLKIEAVGVETSRFYKPVLFPDDIEPINIIQEKPFTFRDQHRDKGEIRRGI
jgi:hypothetical protein